MKSKDQAVKYGRRFNLIGKPTDFTQCEISTDKVERGETLKKIWQLKNISNRSNLEAIASSGGCIVEFGEGENKIQLRFFLKPEVTGINVLEKDRFRKHLSLMCEVFNGGKGKELAFAVKVDKLSESRHFEQTLTTERAVIINSEKDPHGTVVQSVFLPYLSSQMQSNGRHYKTAYLWENVNELNFGFSVTKLQRIGNSG